MKKHIANNQLRRIFKKNSECTAYIKGYIEHMTGLLSRLDYKKLDELVKLFFQAREQGSTIFFIGNGGSSATASHFAQDIGEIGRKTGKKDFRTLSLTDNVSFITAIGNDYGYEEIFKNQLSNLFNKGDILVAISASGNSANLIKAVNLAKKLGGVSVGLVGFDGGKLSKLCDYVVHVTTDKGEYGSVEDIHLIIAHIVATYITWKDMVFRKKIIKRNT